VTFTVCPEWSNSTGSLLWKGKRRPAPSSSSLIPLYSIARSRMSHGPWRLRDFWQDSSSGVRCEEKAQPNGVRSRVAQGVSPSWFPGPFGAFTTRRFLSPSGATDLIQRWAGLFDSARELFLPSLWGRQFSASWPRGSEQIRGRVRITFITCEDQGALDRLNRKAARAVNSEDRLSGHTEKADLAHCAGPGRVEPNATESLRSSLAWA